MKGIIILFSQPFFLIFTKHKVVVITPPHRLFVQIIWKICGVARVAVGVGDRGMGGGDRATTNCYLKTVTKLTVWIILVTPVVLLLNEHYK